MDGLFSRPSIGVDDSTVIYKTLKENKTRMQLEFITGSELGIMFNGEKALCDVEDVVKSEARVLPSPKTISKKKFIVSSRNLKTVA